MLERLNRRADLWLPTYALTALHRAYGHLRRRNQLTHIIFLICDHFEPRHGATRNDQPFERLRIWHHEYARFQERCRSSFGTAPVHTWFYPPHHGVEHLATLSEMVFEGLGEVELHYHHQDDTEETLTRDLKDTLTNYRRWGHLLESGDSPKTSFGFIHGDWALGNSGHGKHCGVNDELTILQNLGCWGDFTMPSGNVCQTRKINSIYYARGSRHRPKSHNWGKDARVGEKDPQGLFLMQGPLGVNWRAPDHPRIENASLTTRNWGRPDRIKKWLDCNIHVKGRPDWLFVKLHAHGAIERDFDALFGEKAFEMHRILNEQFNDGRSYQLHYVTARQAYNIAKAAEQGKHGNPADWKDYRIPPQAHTFYTLNAPHDLLTCTTDRLSIQGIGNQNELNLLTRVGPVEQVVGSFCAIDISSTSSNVVLKSDTDEGEVSVKMVAGNRVMSVEGAKVLEPHTGSKQGLLILRMGQHCQINYCHGSGDSSSTELAKPLTTD